MEIYKKTCLILSVCCLAKHVHCYEANYKASPISKANVDMPVLANEKNIQHNYASPVKLKIKLTNWNQETIKNLLKNLSATDVYFKFSVSTKNELKEIDAWVLAIELLFQKMENQLGSIPKNLEDDLDIMRENIKLMEVHYNDCCNKLKLVKTGNELAFTECIKQLKILQNSIQNLRNSTKSVLTAVLVMIQENINNPIYKKLKKVEKEIEEMKLHCVNLIKITDAIINNLVSLLDVYHQYSKEERNRSLDIKTSVRLR